MEQARWNIFTEPHRVLVYNSSGFLSWLWYLHALDIARTSRHIGASEAGGPVLVGPEDGTDMFYQRQNEFRALGPPMSLWFEQSGHCMPIVSKLQDCRAGISLDAHPLCLLQQDWRSCSPPRKLCLFLPRTYHTVASQTTKTFHYYLFLLTVCVI